MTSRQQDIDERYMREAIALAMNGSGHVSPNPMVGCIIVRNGRILGKGFHREYGGPHAEVNAINAAGDVRGATAYVNLEPCTITGKTPPCADLLIRSGIRRVVVGSLDPNPRVCGRGIRKLRKAGISVRTGVLGGECRQLNIAFAKHITTGLPLITLKVAQTLDGFIADSHGRSHWITGPEARRYGHFLRATHDAIIVGAGTVMKDNPRLTVRSVHGPNPIRIVIDGDLITDPDSWVYSTTRARTVVAVTGGAVRKKARKAAQLKRKGVDLLVLPGSGGRISLKRLMEVLGGSGIGSVLVEGGADIHSQIMKAGLADRADIFIAPKIFGRGISSFGGLTGTSVDGYTPVFRPSLGYLGDDLHIRISFRNKS